jgi:RimJ/RimL family protein N-acetyltransferase
VLLTLRDTGEPVNAPPAAVLALVELGLATAADGGIDGTGNVLVARVPLPRHGRIVETDDLEVLPDDAAASDVPVEVRPLRVEDAFELTRCIFRCYGWTYAVQDMYFPDRIAAAIEAGRRVGGVAVTPDGEVVAHVGYAYVADGVVEGGVAVTDPRFRGRGLMGQVAQEVDLHALGVTAVMGRAVLTHPVTQKASMGLGATLVGMYLDAAGPVQQVGFTDGLIDHRMSYAVTYNPQIPLDPTTIWIPARYQALVRHVLEPSELPLTIGEVHSAPVPPASVMTSSYDALKQAGTVKVATVGDDLVAALDGILGQFRAAGAEQVLVYLPAEQPALATVGAGLPSLQLAYAALLPRFGELGTGLVLQWLRNPAVVIDHFVFADDRFRILTEMIVEQATTLGDQETRQRLRRARLEQLLALLPDDGTA